MHPRELLPLYEQLLAKLAPESSFEYEFSKYVYVPQEVSECRTFFRISPHSFASDFAENVAALRGIEEIAFHSRIEIKNNGRILHVPMIDMGCERIENHLDGLKKALSDFAIGEFSVFNSGR